MNLSSFSRCALTILLSAAVPAGCGSPSRVAMTGAVPQTFAPANRADGGRSWMLPEAKNENLLYASSIGYIYVYSYPELKRVGAIYDYRYPLGLCSDAQGNVYVTEFAYAEITEYAHGGTSPLRTLYDSGSDPRDCSIDSTTGNVAVANYDPGGVVVFPIGSGSPESYSPGLDYPNACAYDGSGNLFVDGSGGGGGFALAELPAGESTFEPIGLNKSIGNAGDVEWDGTYLAVADYDLPSAIYRFAMSGSSGTLVDSISLSGPLYRPEFGNQFAVHGGRVTLPYALKDTENSPGKIGIWAYPAGGALLKKRGHFGASHLFGVTVSIKR